MEATSNPVIETVTRMLEDAGFYVAYVPFFGMRPEHFKEWITYVVELAEDD